MEPHQDPTPAVIDGPVPKCGDCDRLVYQEALASRLVDGKPGAKAYECPHGRGWHVIPAPR
ncbi:hypothetical protein RB614_37820 [Phytohabitans sp. ZYX-F-186]|uniref:TFIIS-type domain-containing protein n=1 Tax=Phytohabitans maris TaxID=3071409 RepID=A0ABU0ZTI2_9ACTN|nr:hypothetical protein [Phytohabitans sp. ZYX-F-186]MDQ7910268.1 hypothetical protein [Phytohabitans sp. ZYX-F-186]